MHLCKNEPHQKFQLTIALPFKCLLRRKSVNNSWKIKGYCLVYIMVRRCNWFFISWNCCYYKFIFLQIIFNFFWPELNNINLENMMFQEDGAKPHFVNETILLLNEHINNRVILRKCNLSWSLKSCDLTHLDF